MRKITIKAMRIELIGRITVVFLSPQPKVVAKSFYTTVIEKKNLLPGVQLTVM